MVDNQKPIETFTQKELDTHTGELADFYAEAVEIKDEGTLEDKTEHIMHVVTLILREAAKQNQFNLEVIVINSKLHAATLPVATYYHLNIAQSDSFPQNEVFVTTMSEVQALIINRVLKTKGYVPDTTLKGVKISG